MAKFELKLPKMGESVAEATITSWLKDVGDTIEADEAVLEIAFVGSTNILLTVPPPISDNKNQVAPPSTDLKIVPLVEPQK